MIQANELRIGNFINACSTNIYDVVTELEEKVMWFNNSISKDYVSYDQIKSILLTEEWFLKFGFIIRYFNNDKNKPLMWKVENNRHIELYFEKQVSAYVFMINSMQYSTEIKSVHQLQNLYFALTNKELTLCQ